MLIFIGQRRQLLILLLLLTGLATPVYALNLGAYWLYRQSGGEGLDTREEFQQRYSLGAGPSFSYQPTHAISTTAAVSYSRTQVDRGNGMATLEELTPTAQLSLVNDIFLAQLSGSSTTRRTAARDNTSQSWDATLGSTWHIPFWPSIHFNYGERTDDIDSAQKNTYSTEGVDWDLELAKLTYRHSISRDEDTDNNSVFESESNFARLESIGSTKGRRINYNFAQQYLKSTQNATQGSTVVLNGEAWGKIDSTDPTNVLYVDPSEDTASKNLTTSGELALATGDTVHINFKNLDVFDRSIQILRIYTENPTAETLVWDLYIRDQANNWQQVVTSTTLQGNFVDDSKGQRIEIPLPNNLSADEILLVAHNTAGPLTFTKVEAVSTLGTSFSGNSADYLTNFSLRVRLTDTLSASANLTLENLLSETENSRPLFQRHRIISGRLSWSPAPYLLPSLGYSENLDTRTAKEDQLSRFYSLTVATIPLPSMHMVFSVTHNERYEGDQQTATGDKYSLSTKAQIYPDLSADLSFSQNNGEQVDNDGVVTDTSAFSTRLNLNAQLLKGVTADLTTSYLRSEKESENVSGSTNLDYADMTLRLLYRPSDLLAVHGAYTTYFLDSATVDSYSLGMNLGLLRTDKTRLTLTADHQQAQTISDNLTLKGSWDISRSMSMLVRGSYTTGDNDIYDVMATLSLWF